jgi:uncharacterized protein involved in response to NO
MTNKPFFKYPLFAMGFRVFFALAALSALGLIAFWSGVMKNGGHLQNYYPATLWHAHEMLLGYTGAVIAGFLLTAVRNWTGRQTTTPDQLAALSLLWLYGRLTPFFSEALPGFLIAAIDFAFLPTLAYFVGKPLLETGNRQNLIFLLLLLLLAFANAMIHAEILQIAASGQSGLHLLLALIVTMIIVISGRIFPFFTERGLSGVICMRNPVLDLVAAVSGFAGFLLLIFDVYGLLLALVAVVAAVSNSLRLAGWYDRRIWFVPLLWVLYAGYVWLILGFILLALAAYQILPLSLALHAFALGGIGVLTLGMMARVALGHTGRALKVSNIMALAFILINIAAFCRVVFPALFASWSGGFLLVSGYCWLAAFSLFVFYYAPILLSARVDGQPG